LQKNKHALIFLAIIIIIIIIKTTTTSYISEREMKRDEERCSYALSMISSSQE